jgi:hypothetical protein
VIFIIVDIVDVCAGDVESCKAASVGSDRHRMLYT